MVDSFQLLKVYNHLTPVRLIKKKKKTTTTEKKSVSVDMEKLEPLCIAEFLNDFSTWINFLNYIIPEYSYILLQFLPRQDSTVFQ